MDTISVEVPQDLAPLVQGWVDHVARFRGAAREGTAGSFAEGERELMTLTAALESAGLGSMLASLDPEAPRVEVGGVVYSRLNQRATCMYGTLRGEVVVNRHLYRQEGVRNGPTVVPLDLRAGIVDGRFTPAAALGFARMAQAMPSREAEATCEALHVLPYSRTEHFRMGVEMGSRWDDLRAKAELALVTEMELHPAAASLSVAVDRVSLPMAEPRTPTPEDEEKGIKKPISVQLRMAYSAVWTLYDHEGTPLQSVRYAHVPTGGVDDMERSLRRDVGAVLDRAPHLRTVTLADGAPEMQHLLDRVVQGREVAAQLVDFWHCVDHLGKAIAATGRYAVDLLHDWKMALLERDDAIDRILSTLRDWAMPYVLDPAEAVPADLWETITYLTNHGRRLRYATVHRAGLPVGSGTVEATGKTIVEVRMRRSGCRWVERERGPQALLGLRALATSEPKRWKAASEHILASYQSEVTLLPARPLRGRPARVGAPAEDR
jgi:hypothetical protein